LKGWGQSLKGHTRKYKNILKEELEIIEKLEEESTLDVVKLERKTFIQTELLRLMEEEESYWHKRANSTWLLKADCNTTFSIKLLMGRKGKTPSSP
jgi:hypothetical protein